MHLPQPLPETLLFTSCTSGVTAAAPADAAGGGVGGGGGGRGVVVSARGKWRRGWGLVA